MRGYVMDSLSLIREMHSRAAHRTESSKCVTVCHWDDIGLFVSSNWSSWLITPDLRGISKISREASEKELSFSDKKRFKKINLSPQCHISTLDGSRQLMATRGRPQITDTSLEFLNQRHQPSWFTSVKVTRINPYLFILWFIGHLCYLQLNVSYLTQDF